jgi:YggT family protein
MEFIVFFIINVIRILKYAILVRVLLSWFQNGYPGRFSDIIFSVTEPILKIFRSIIPRIGMIDISPLLAFFVLDFAQLWLAGLIIQ